MSSVELERPLMRHERRSFNQLPLFVSADAARVIRWARQNCTVERQGGVLTG